MNFLYRYCLHFSIHLGKWYFTLFPFPSLMPLLFFVGNLRVIIELTFPCDKYIRMPILLYGAHLMPFHFFCAHRVLQQLLPGVALNGFFAALVWEYRIWGKGFDPLSVELEIFCQVLYQQQLGGVLELRDHDKPISLLVFSLGLRLGSFFALFLRKRCTLRRPCEHFQKADLF